MNLLLTRTDGDTIKAGTPQSPGRGQTERQQRGWRVAGERGWAAVEGAGTEDAASGHERAWKHSQWAHDDMMTITGHVALTLQRWEG